MSIAFTLAGPARSRGDAEGCSCMGAVQIAGNLPHVESSHPQGFVHRKEGKAVRATFDLKVPRAVCARSLVLLRL